MKLTLLAVLLLLTPVSLFAQDIESFLGKLDSRAYKPGSDDAIDAPQQLNKFLKIERERVNQEDLQAWRDLASKNDRQAWESDVRKRIAAMEKSLGTFPARAADVPVHITKTLPGEGFVIDNLVYESRPGLWVSANLYRPDPLPKSAPGILIISSHHNSKTEGELQDMGMTWARLGSYVLIPDQLGHGERRQHPFHDAKSHPQSFKVGRQDYYFRYNLGVQLHMIGESLTGWMANDMMAGVTLLLKKTSIDPARIILLGSVAGGGDPAAVTAALDPRIKCLVPFNFGGPQPETKFPLPADAEASFNYFGGGSWESTRNLAGSGSGGFLPWEIVASIAPRHLIHAHEFAWDGERDPAWKRYQTIWNWYGAKDNIGVAHGKGSLQGKYPEATHCNNIGPEHRAMIYPHLKKWFNIPIPEKEVKSRVPGELLRCWTPELKAKLKPRAVHELAAEIWEKGRPAGMWDDKNNNSLKPMFPSPTAFQEDKYRILSEESDEPGDGIVVRRIVLRGLKWDLDTPLLLLEPQPKDYKGRVVIAFAQQGKKAFLEKSRSEIAGLLKQGIAVCLPDLPGTGETKSSDSRGRSSGATSISATVRMHGGTMLGIRFSSLAQVAEFLTKDAVERKLDSRIALWGDSFAPVNGPNDLVAVPYDSSPVPALAEPMGGLLVVAALNTSLHKKVNIRCVLGRGGLVSFASVFRSPFVHVPHDALEVPIVTGADLDDLGAVFLPNSNLLNTPKRVDDGVRCPAMCRLEGMVDGVNRAMTQADVDASFARSRKVMGDGGRLSLRAERSSADEVVSWLVKCLQ